MAKTKDQICILYFKTDIHTYIQGIHTRSALVMEKEVL